jgi:hypothetical protein
MNKPTLRYRDFKPLVNPDGTRDKRKRYVSKSNDNDIISVRHFQSQAHREAGTAPIRVKPLKHKQKDVPVIKGGNEGTTDSRKSIQKYYAVVKRLDNGESLKSASQSENISPTTIRKLNEERTADREYKGKNIQGNARRLYTPKYEGTNKAGKAIRRGFTVHSPDDVPIFKGFDTDGTYIITTINTDKIYSSIVGRYWNVVDKVVKGDLGISALSEFTGKSVYDVNGVAYPLITDVNQLLLLFGSMSEDEKGNFWLLFNSR